MMNIVFSDIDGTFQGLGLPVAPINLEAVDYLKARGDHFVFVTGRGIDMVEMMQEELGISCDIIFGNGAGLKKDGETATYRNCLTLSDLEAVLPILEGLGLLYFVHTDKETVIPTVDRFDQNLADLAESLGSLGETGKQIMAYKKDYFENECHQVPDVLAFFKAQRDRHIVKIELMEASDRKHEVVRDQLSALTVFFFSSFVHTLEIVNPLSTKGAAIRSYLQDFTAYKSFGIGDGENDLPMFEAVNVAVAMENAPEDIKDKCDVVTESCESGGVGKFIFDYCK